MIDGVHLMKKLQAKPGARLWLINAPAEVTQALKGPATLTKAGEPCDGVVAFCQTPAEVEACTDKAIAALPEDGLLWFGYRKGAAAKASGLNRDVGWAPLAKAGWRGVRSIAFDDDWTGIRFRPLDKVQSRD